MTRLPVRRKCNIPRCRRNAPRGRHRCNTCRCRIYARSHPDIIAFLNLRKSAKRRGHEFSLTLEEFRSFAAKYDYMDKRGRSATGYTVDRVDEQWGYHAWNLQVLTNSENTAKENARRREAFVYAKIYGWQPWCLEPF